MSLTPSVSFLTVDVSTVSSISSIFVAVTHFDLTDLNRSQPPLFIQMLARYVQASGDKSILDRALPLAEKELKWWEDNRQVQVTPSSGKAHSLFRYNVNNTAPRPESYLTGPYLAF